MARITNITPPCGYNTEGLAEIYVLDFEDFKGYKFENGATYATHKVTAILRAGEFSKVASPDSARYGSTLSNNIYSHVLETFIADLNADILRNLHLGSKRRYVVVFKSKAGKYYTYGYEAGAVLTYTTQTPDSLGATVTFTAASVYALFEAEADALLTGLTGEFRPNFSNGAFCTII